jgi:hypothetical protein
MPQFDSSPQGNGNVFDGALEEGAMVYVAERLGTNVRPLKAVDSVDSRGWADR